MKLTVHFVNAFTEKVFKGNSAAVIVTDNWLSDSLMQSIASENNLSETAFVVADIDNIYDIRWFSPITEIDFCGHATLASAFVLFSQNNELKSITFRAKAVGDLLIKQKSKGHIEMDFPNRKPTIVEKIPDALLQGLSISPIEVYRNEQAYFAIYSHENDVRAVITNSEQLKKLAPFDVVVTATATDYDFVSRYFWPANGGDEDAVTGSIHAGLAPFWAQKLGKNQLLAHQASARGGRLACIVTGDRVKISGQAVLYLTGTVNI
jgi:PhzF family phenazine biosynthesis protein